LPIVLPVLILSLLPCWVLALWRTQTDLVWSLLILLKVERRRSVVLTPDVGRRIRSEVFVNQFSDGNEDAHGRTLLLVSSEMKKK
jgi:hypothetical protein